jgi:N-acetylneuraminic acid mutarotase
MGNYIQKFTGLFLATFLLTISSVISQIPTFTWMSGDEVWNQGPNNVSIGAGIYGTKTSPAVANVVGSRQGSLSWKDASGNLWLFGGIGRDKNSSNGYMNDLWKYNPTTNLWTWMKGSEFIRQGSVYGTKGTPSLNNTPGARAYSVTWTDANGDLWLFGGYGYDQAGVTLRNLNDLWKFNVSTNQWTWISGSDVANRIGIYGTKGTAASDNVPGSRQYSISWADANGNLWLFGGTGFDKNGAQGNLNDLWKYNIASNRWTWVSGSDRVYQNIFQNNIYGTKGTPSVNNIPSARYSSASWIDANGNLMLFGGYGTDKNGSWGYLNDLWRFNSSSNEWTWVSGSDIINQSGVYGIKGTASANNNPGARRESVTWKDNSGTLWLFGGIGIDKAGVFGYLNDLWKYNSATNQWTWVGGGDLVNRIGTIGTKQTASVNNIPSSRSRSNSWVDASGNLWVFGGYGLDVNSSYGYLNNLWKYNISTNQWTWVNGSEYVNQSGNYGTKGDPLYDINIAGARQYAVSWNDANGDHWFFGGMGRDKNGTTGYLNDLWKYNKTNKEWIWVSGSDIVNQNGVYGTKGVSASSNVPGARNSSVAWTDASGNLWLYGGNGRDRNGSIGYLNDLWKYNPSNNTWTWVNGNDFVNAIGTYGTKGAASSSNIPGGRLASVSFQDANGFLWLFGGFGRDKNGFTGYLNDLWKYNISTNVWTWVNGDDIVNQSGAYGSKGVSSLSNKPGARQYAAGSIDANDNIWLYGGLGFDQNGSQGYLNDLWKYEIATNRWTWISGNGMLNQNGVYGTKGVSSTNNISGGRYGANFVADNNGDLWLLGGLGRDKNGSFGYLNDLWHLKVSTNEWTWVQGSDIINQAGFYGTKAIASNNNVPGARSYSSILKDFDGNLILFGGVGYDASGSSGYLNDMWKFNLGSKQWTWLSGNDIYQKAGVYGSKGVSSSNNLPGARQLPVSWTDNNGYLWLFGGIGYDKNGKTGYLNDLWVYSSGINEWKWVSGSENVNQIGVYGTKGVASVNNLPGARRGSSSWVDKTGNLLLFGGFGYDKNGSLGYLNDLWKYDIASNQWSWMGGSDVVNQSAIYGSLGIAASSNIPGARQYATNWADSTTNTLWLYGGQGYIEDGALGALNDLWKYNMSTNVWTWVSGSKAINQNGIYGTKGVAANSNIPGARYYAQAWLGENGKLLLFGGQGYDKNASISALNDFWSYNINTNQWTWIGGSDVVGQNGVYGSKGVSAVSNIPGGRYQSNAWKDSKNNLWLFGGIGRDKNGSQSYLNDLWKYNPVNNQWTWVSGSDIFGQLGVYGTKELPSVNNIPGARIGGTGWKDASGNFWVFGGQGYDKNGTTGYLNDMWGVAICDNFVKPTFDANKKIVCLSDTVTINITNKRDGDLFSWFYSNESDSTSNDFTKKFTDTMNLFVLKTNTLGCGIISSDTLRINRTPVSPIITKNTDQTLLASSNNLTWYKNAIKILDTTQRIKPDSNGLYSVSTTQLGCESLKSVNVPFVIQPSLNSISSTVTTDTLSWSIKDSSRLKSFIIYKDTVRGSSKLLDSTLASKRSYIDSLERIKNVVYFYKIKATDRDNAESVFSNELRTISFSPPSAVSPTNLSVKNDTSILFKWRKIPNALKYNLEFGTDSTFGTSTKIQLADTMYAKNFNQNTNYYWRVQTLDTTHFSSYSAISRFQTFILPPSLDIVKSGNMVDTLSWSVKDSSRLKSFIIYKDTVTGSSKLLDSTLASKRSYIDSLDRIKNVVYFYKIKAINRDNIESVFSNVLRTISFSPPSAVSPTNLSVKNDTSAIFKWRKIPNALKYNLEFGTDSTFRTSTKIQLADTMYAKNLNQNTDYYWRVQTLDTTRFSSYSAISRFQTFILAPSLDSVKPGNKVDTLSWSVKGVNDLKYFKIYRDTVASPTKFLDSVSGNARRYIDTISLQNNKKYYYRILAGNQQNIESNFSNILNAIPVNALPKSVKLVNRTVQNAGEFNFVKLSYSASGSFDTDGKIASYNWYVNDSLVNKTDSILSYTYKLGSHTIKLIVIDNEGGKDSSISLLNLSSLQKVFPAGILGGISAINPNYILTADTSFNNTTGSSVSILDRSGNTIFPIVVQSKIFTTPSISSDTSIFITNGSSLNGYSKSGVSLWPTIPLGGISYVTPTIDSNLSRIYVGVSNKNFFAYDYKTGKNVWSIICDAPINTSAVITGDRRLIFTSQTGTLYGFDISKSDIQTTPKWKMSFGDIITKSPAVDASSNIYVGTNAGRLIKFMLNTDGSVSVKWNVSLGSAIQTSPVIDADSNIYVGTEKGDFYKINRFNGSTIWSYNVGAAIYSTPNISEYGTIYVPNMNGLVTAITTDKRVLWKYQDIGPISANSLYINNMLYVASEKGTFTGIYDNPNSVNVNTTISSSGNSISSSVGNISNPNNLNASSANISTSLITPRKPVWGTFQGDYRRTGSLSLICPNSLSISRSANGNLISNTPNYIQWYKDGTEILNATDSIFKPTLAGNYLIKNNQAGCNIVSSNSYYYLVTDIIQLNNGQFIKLTPNPFINFMNIDFVVKGHQRMNIEVFSASTGAKVAVRIGVTAGSRLTFNELNPGIYFVRVASPDMKVSHQFKMVKL